MNGDSFQNGIHLIRQTDSHYPIQLVRRWGSAAPDVLFAAGRLDILKQPGIGLICSIQCPGSIILKTFDAIRKLRDENVMMIGGFHSPMERECLNILLRGSQPVILCPARKLHGLRMGRSARKALSDGRLLVLSIFGEDVRRATSREAVLRNDLVAALADAIFVPHAIENGKTWATLHKAIGNGQRILTVEDAVNSGWVGLGAVAQALGSE